MEFPSLDDVDRLILRHLQRNARHTTATEIADAADVSPNTVRNRLRRLENEGVITGYRPDIDYERAGFPMRVLVVCTAPISEREALAREACSVDGVVNVRELMSGTDNVRVEVVGNSNADITRIVTQLNEFGLRTTDEILVRNEFFLPFERWETSN